MIVTLASGRVEQRSNTICTCLVRNLIGSILAKRTVGGNLLIPAMIPAIIPVGHEETLKQQFHPVFRANRK